MKSEVLRPRLRPQVFAALVIVCLAPALVQVTRVLARALEQVERKTTTATPPSLTDEGPLYISGGGTPQFRNLDIQDGRGGSIATFVGEANMTTFSGDVHINGRLFVDGKEMKP